MGGTEALRSLAELRAERPLSPPEVLGVMRDVANVLATAHARGQVHGAICAENIVLDAAGAARLCHDTVAPSQLSPEQRRGQPPEARSDIFALGAAIAELLPEEPPAPEPLRRLLATMRADDPELRPQTTGEVLLGIEACELMAGLRAVRPGHVADAARERRPLLPLIVLGFALLVLGLALLALLGRTPPPAGAPPESFKPLIENLAPRPKR